MPILNRIKHKLESARQEGRDRAIYKKVSSRSFQWQPADARIIFSESRGGSTWLFEMLLRSPGAVTQWEPLHPVKGTINSLQTSWGDRPYVPVGVEVQELKECLERTLNGTSWTYWTSRYNIPSQLDNASFLLTKFVRANMLAPWMVQQFGFRYKPVMLIRHPIAVASSQVNYFRSARTTPEQWSVPECPNNDRFLQYESYLKGMPGMLEQKVALWCINNMPVIRDETFMQLTIPVFYEHLVVSPQKELNRICEAWHIPHVSAESRKASSTAGRTGVESDPLDQISKWRSRLGKEQLMNCQRILEDFGCTLYRADDPLPRDIDSQ